MVRAWTAPHTPVDALIDECLPPLGFTRSARLVVEVERVMVTSRPCARSYDLRLGERVRFHCFVRSAFARAPRHRVDHPRRPRRFSVIAERRASKVCASESVDPTASPIEGVPPDG